MNIHIHGKVRISLPPLTHTRPSPWKNEHEKINKRRRVSKSFPYRSFPASRACFWTSTTAASCCFCCMPGVSNHHRPGTYSCCCCGVALSRTAVLFWGQVTLIPSNLSPKRDCVSEQSINTQLLIRTWYLYSYFFFSSLQRKHSNQTIRF